MIRKTFFTMTGICLLFLLTPGLLCAEATVNTEGKLRLFSTIMLQDDEEGFPPHKAGDFGLIKGEGQLEFNGYVADRASYYLRVDFIYTDPSGVYSLQDTEGFDWESTSPVDINLFEGYMNISDLVVDGLDLKLGKQRTKWGTADKLHVVDNLNPNDFANFFTFDPDYFGEKIPVTTMTLTYNRWGWRLTGAYLFSRHEASFPTGYWDLIGAGFSGAMLSEYGMAIYPQTSIEGEDTRVDTAPFGFRLAGTLGKVDIGLSYYKGYLDVPIIKETSISMLSESASADLLYFYPKLQVAGLDLAGELFTVGYWAEVAYFMPEDVKGKTTVETPQGPMEQEAQLFEDGYLKYTVGIDYTFGIGDGLYVNFQYNHGFYDELDYHQDAEDFFGMGVPGFMSELEDYFTADISYDFMGGDINLELFSMLEVADFDEFEDHYTFVVFPKVSYKPTDGTKLEIGTALGDTGAEETWDTKFGMMKKSGMLYLLAELEF